MNRFLRAALLAGLFACPTLGHGAVRVVTLLFGSATPDYVVPAGKVLLIEHISAFFGNSSGGAFDKVIVSIQAIAENSTALITTPWSFSTNNPAQSIHLERPLRAAAGSRVNNAATTTGAAKDVRIQGLLVDEADLYAANLGIDVKGVSLANQKLNARVKLSSARPAILRSEVSFDLQSWLRNPTQAVSKNAAPMSYDISTRVELSDTRKFLRASARTPEIP